MERCHFFNTSRYSGGILPSCIVVFVLLSSLSLLILTNYRQEMLAYEQTIQFYQVEVLKNITIQTIRQEQVLKKQELAAGKLCYTVGEVCYELEKNKVSLTITLTSGLHRQLVVML